MSAGMTKPLTLGVDAQCEHASVPARPRGRQQFRYCGSRVAGRGGLKPRRMERRVTETVVTALVVGSAVGGYVGYQIGNWRAAHRAARATYRTQRGLR